jgi:hypothetical protein
MKAFADFERFSIKSHHRRMYVADPGWHVGKVPYAEPLGSSVADEPSDTEQDTGEPNRLR